MHLQPYHSVFYKDEILVQSNLQEALSRNFYYCLNNFIAILPPGMHYEKIDPDRVPAITKQPLLWLLLFDTIPLLCCFKSAKVQLSKYVVRNFLFLYKLINQTGDAVSFIMYG